MPPSPSRSTDAEFSGGYERGRHTCLTKGPEVARRWLETQAPSGTAAAPSSAGSDAAFAGYAQAVWDYEDANGLPYPVRPGIWP